LVAGSAATHHHLARPEVAGWKIRKIDGSSGSIVGSKDVTQQTSATSHWQERYDIELDIAAQSWIGVILVDYVQGTTT